MCRMQKQHIRAFNAGTIQNSGGRSVGRRCRFRATAINDCARITQSNKLLSASPVNRQTGGGDAPRNPQPRRPSVAIPFGVIICADDEVRRRRYSDHFVTMCVCGWVCLHDKTKTHDRNDLKLGTIVIIDTLSKPIGLGFKRSRGRVRVNVTTQEESAPNCISRQYTYLLV